MPEAKAAAVAWTLAIGPHQSITLMGELFAGVQATDFAAVNIATVTTMEPVNLPEHYGTVAFSGRAAESA